MADSILSKQHEPTAIFEFTLINPDSKVSTSSVGSDNGIEKVCTEFSHQELYSFFNDLERIQGQLDNLSGQG